MLQWEKGRAANQRCGATHQQRGGEETMRLSFKFAVVISMAAMLAPQLRAQTSLAQAQYEYTIPEGTEFKLALHTEINSKTSRKGDVVITTLLDPVYVEDRLVLPRGVRVYGHITDIHRARRRGKGGMVYIEFDSIELPSGQKVAILGSLTEVFSSSGKTGSKVGPEGNLRGGGANRKEQIAMFAAPTAAGAVGGVGPGIAAAAGGLAAAILLPHGKQARLLAGSLIGMRLDQDVTITLPPPKHPLHF